MAEPIKVQTKSTHRMIDLFTYGNDVESHVKDFKVLGEQVHGASFAHIIPPHVSYEYPTNHPTTDDMGVPTLFGTEPPPKPKIETMGSNRGGANTVATVLGAAIDESRRRWKTDPVPSTDLSSHSIKLVNRLINKGVIDPDTPAEQENSFGRVEGEKWTRHVQHDFNPDVEEGYIPPDTSFQVREFSPAEVSHAQSTIRNLLKGRLKPTPNQNLNTTQFTQGELF